MKRTTIGVDLAQQVFELSVEDGATQVVVRQRLSRKKMLAWFANCPSALVGMEGCGGAQYWARELTKAGARGAADCPAVWQTLGPDSYE